MTLGSLFDGLGGWQLAAVHNGITPIWSCEIDSYCRLISHRHFTQSIQLGDIRGITNPPFVDIITAGFPCNDISIAGHRAGLAGERSCLFYDAIRIIRNVKPKFAIFENVVGLLSSNNGADFHSVLEQIAESQIPIPSRWSNAGLVDCSDRQIAWRILDSQYFGVPQRRRRIFIICSFGSRRAAQILFECEGLRGNFETRKTQVKGIAPPHFRRAFGFGRDAFNSGKNAKFGLSLSEDIQPPLTARGAAAVFDGYVVRRLTPRECERLMGLPDDWTAGISDSQRYKMIGNGMAQPVADWILRGVTLCK